MIPPQTPAKGKTTKTLGSRSDQPQPGSCIADPRADERALFVPLKTEYFNAFAAGTKTEELRRYGPRWNERTCRVGRAVVLSQGYGKARRLNGRIWKFKRQHGATFGSTYRAAILSVFGTLDIEIACFAIEVRR